jgi:membrane protease YdiL (CAAX protease family)
MTAALKGVNPESGYSWAGICSLFTFFSLTYAATWTCWAAAAAISREPSSSDPIRAGLAGALILLGTVAPSLVALALTQRAEGRAATRALLDRIFLWDVDARWYVFAVGYIPAIKLSAAAVHRVVTGDWPRFGDEAWYLMAAAIVFSTWLQAGEEIGWRGYALPRLSARVGLGPASVILGVIWASWHLPLFFFSGADKLGQSFPLYLLQVTALSVAAAWLYWRTGGSLLLVMLLHAAVNNTKDIVPSAVPGATNPFALSTSLVAWLTVAHLWMAAAYFLVRMRNRTLFAPLGAPGTRTAVPNARSSPEDS